MNDPIEDNPNHDWTDYRVNWESTLTASLLQPDVAKFEVAPWPERVFGGRYPRSAAPEDRRPIPPAYATELQTVFNTLTDMNQPRVEWDCGTPGIGVLISDSLMFQRGQPTPSDPYLGNFYGLAMPLVKHGLPVAPVQLEDVVIPNYLAGFHVLLLSYDGQKSLTPEVHASLAAWVRAGGILIFCDRDADPYLKVRDWWNTGGNHYATPRQHLFEKLGVTDAITAGEFNQLGSGGLIWLRERPVEFSVSKEGAAQVVAVTKSAAEKAGLKWRETNWLLLRRGPYVIAAGMDESIPGEPKTLRGRFVNLFDSQLKVLTEVSVVPNSRWFLLDLDTAAAGGDQRLLASACKALPKDSTPDHLSFTVEGVGDTPAIMLLKSPKPPGKITLDGQPLTTFEYSAAGQLLWIHFTNDTSPRELAVQF